MFSEVFANLNCKSEFLTNRLSNKDTKFCLALHYYFLVERVIGQPLLASYLNNRIAYLLGALSNVDFKFPAFSGFIRELKFFENGVVEIAASSSVFAPLESESIFIEATPENFDDGVSYCFVGDGDQLAITNSVVGSFENRFTRGHSPFCSFNNEVLQCVIDTDNWSKFVQVLYSQFPVCDCYSGSVLTPTFVRRRIIRSLCMFVEPSHLTENFNYSQHRFTSYFFYLSLNDRRTEYEPSYDSFRNARGGR